MNKNILFLLILLMTLVFARGVAPKLVVSDDLEKAKKAYDNKDYSTALELFRPLAEEGNAEAQFGLGLMYDERKGVKRNQEEAMRWYRKSAEQGYAKAQFRLGNLYYWGKGVEEDYEEAVKWFRKSAEQGNAKAQFNLGWIYAEGEGVEQDNKEAMKWYRKSAEQGYTKAQFILGWMYDEGAGVEEDKEEALRWYRKATEGMDVDIETAKNIYDAGDYVIALGIVRLLAEEGNAEAQNALGNLYYWGRGAAEDNKEAVKWYRKSAEQGNVDAQFNLGLMHDEGAGVEEDKEEALRWYRKAAEGMEVDIKNAKNILNARDYIIALGLFRLLAEEGNAEAQFRLGNMYYKGEGVEENYKEAARWFRKSAEGGYIEAQFHLGLMYDEGAGVEEDKEEALRWYRKAAEGMEVDIKNAKNIYNAGDYVIALGLFRLLAEEDNAEAQFRLGNMYYKGEGVEQSYEEAVKWYRKSAEQGYTKAQFILGWIYDEGKGVAEDKEEALRWYRKAAEGMEVDIKNAKNILNARDYIIALGLFRLLAEEGNAEAQFRLGNMYYKGEGVEQDYKEAVKWYRKSAEGGYIEAQFNLGLMYDEGKGVAEDKEEALRWYRKAAEGMEVDIKNAKNILNAGDYVIALGLFRLLAEEGNAEAQFRLGNMYYEGVEKNYKEAARWYQESAYRGNTDAQINFGLMYAKGEGVEQNDILAYMWLSISGQVGDKARSEFNQLEKRMSSEDLLKAQTLAQQCMESDYQNCGE